jgi:hypothetical protein
MTYQPQQPYQPPVVPGPAYQPPPQNDWTPPKSKRGPLPWLIGGLVVLVLVVGGLIAALANGGDKPTAGASSAPLPQDPCGGGICNTEPAAATATTPAATHTPDESDFKLTAKVTSKDCFGSAGCNVTFRPNVSYIGALPLDSDTTWMVVYEISGVEDAPLVANLTIEGDTATFDEQVVSTKSSKSKITLKVTSVEKN